MCISGRLCSVTIAAILTASLASWPTAAAAAGQSDPDTEEGIRSDRAAAFQMEGSEAKSSRLVLRLYGGFGRSELGDINRGLDGYYEILELYKAMLGGGTTTGGYNPLRDGYNAGADLVFQLSPKFGIGIGAGYMRFSESSAMTLSTASDRWELSGTPKLSAVPIRVGLFITLPLGKRLNLTVNGGADAYAMLKLDSTQRVLFGASQEDSSLSASGGSPFDNLGFHGSLGFEFMFSRNTGFFVEAEGRYARLKNFEKATEVTDSETTEGRLYLVTETSDHGSVSEFMVMKIPPPENLPLRFSEPKIDLGGFSLQAGLRIRL